MIRLAPLAFLALALPAVAQEAPPAPPPSLDAAAPPATTPKFATVRVALVTSLGPVEVEVETERAPLTAANFLKYVDGKRLDGINFYRAVKVQEGYGLIQAGVRGDPKRVLPRIAHEPTTRTGLSHLSGTLSMARAAPGTADGEFFITLGDMTSMDAQPEAAGDNLGFAAFGRVVAGMDVVARILDAPRSPTEGEGVMKGQMLDPPVRIVSARRMVAVP